MTVMVASAAAISKFAHLFNLLKIKLEIATFGKLH
jgi:hypothetical protein